jgi:hypothetical protein
MDFTEFHEGLVSQGIGIFNISLEGDTRTLIHPKKTVMQWRQDVRSMIQKSRVVDQNGNADNFDLVNALIGDFGYFEVEFLADDVYEGRRAIYESGIVDDPAHEDQNDGFGHYGLTKIEE